MVKQLLAVVLLGLPACSSSIRIQSQPLGAVAAFENGERLVTPVDVPLSKWPRQRETVIFSATGYRTVEMKIPYSCRDEWMIVLVPEHGPAGTWNEEDLP